MTGPVPILYVPTQAARAAAIAALGATRLYAGNNPNNLTGWEGWESMYGDTHHWMMWRDARDHWFFETQERVNHWVAEGRGTLVNSPAHFIRYLKSKGEI